MESNASLVGVSKLYHNDGFECGIKTAIECFPKSSQEILLMGGEMTDQELRTVKAVLGGVKSRIEREIK